MLLLRGPYDIRPIVLRVYNAGVPHSRKGRVVALARRMKHGTLPLTSVTTTAGRVQETQAGENDIRDKLTARHDVPNLLQTAEMNGQARALLRTVAICLISDLLLLLRTVHIMNRKQYILMLRRSAYLLLHSRQMVE